MLTSDKNVVLCSLARNIASQQLGNPQPALEANWSAYFMCISFDVILIPNRVNSNKTSSLQK